MRQLMIVLAVLTLAVSFSATTTNAQSELTLSSGLSSVTFVGVGNTPITEVGQVVNGWTINVVVGETNTPNLSPLYGIDITSLTVSCVLPSPCSSAPLTISFSGTGFTQPVSALGFFTTYTLLAATGTGESTTHMAWDDTSNVFFGTGTPIGTIGPISSAPQSQTKIGGGPAGPGAYSLTINDTFNAGGSKATFSANGDIGAVVTPEPGSMLLFGTGLLALGGVLRRKLLA